MIVITQDTDKVFKDEILACAHRPDTWKCLVFNFSKMERKPEDWFSIILDKVSSGLGEKDTRAFLFEDGDLYFLLKYATQKAYQTLIEKISEIFNPEIQKLSSLYEVRVDLEQINKLRERKVVSTPPQAPATTPAAAPPPARSVSSARSARPFISILAIEDDPFSLRLIDKSIGKIYSLHTAEDGKTGLQTYLETAPDILFLDIGLPDTNGLELMEEILKHDPSAYIIILSGNGNRENVMAAIQKGAKGFVAKPFSREKLIHYIQKNPFQKIS